MYLDPHRASSRAKDHVRREAVDVLPIAMSSPTEVNSTMRTFVTADEEVAWNQISNNGTLEHSQNRCQSLERSIAPCSRCDNTCNILSTIEHRNHEQQCRATCHNNTD